MQIPFFYKERIDPAIAEIALDEDASKHIVQVLRMKSGGQLNLTDGRGNLFSVEIVDNPKKKCIVKILSCTVYPAPERNATIAVSLVKNTHRFEWFLEKATEIGVTNIIPLICNRTEKTNFRMDRMKSILVSAMRQSQQAWLPLLHEPIKFSVLIKQAEHGQKFIAHCKEDETKSQLLSYRPFRESIILIGPEGDFTTDEIELALQHDFISVALGNTRLRTETAGMVGATLLCMA